MWKENLWSNLRYCPEIWSKVLSRITIYVRRVVSWTRFEKGTSRIDVESVRIRASLLVVFYLRRVTAVRDMYNTAAWILIYVPLRRIALCIQGRVGLQASLAVQASSTSRRPTWRHNTSNFLQAHADTSVQLCVLVAEYLQTLHGYIIWN
jgi:hypothetical protein